MHPSKEKDFGLFKLGSGDEPQGKKDIPGTGAGSVPGCWVGTVLLQKLLRAAS